jgi:hypothetical protein
MKMEGKSPMMKALVGKQKNLNEGLKAAIKAAPGKIMEKTPMNMKMESAIKIGMAKKPAPMKIKKPAPMKVAKPDFPDVDGDGDRKESISKASRDAKAVGKVMKNSALKKEGEEGKKIEYKKSTRKWNSPKDLQNATSMVMAKINKAMPTPSAKKKELTAQAKKLLSTGAVGNLDKLMDRNNIAGDFTSFKGFSITPKKKK